MEGGELGDTLVKRPQKILVALLRSAGKLYRDDSGAFAVEYVVLTGFLGIFLIPTAETFADAVRVWFWNKVFRVASV
jgi:Flp pilus assembly pilin Flp